MRDLSYKMLTLSIVLVCIPALLQGKTGDKLKTTRLTTEYKENPVGLGTSLPRLSWELVSEERNTLQTAYRIKVARTAGELKSGKNLLWDTRKVLSDQCVLIPYGGVPLNPAQNVFWQVQVWDNHGNVSRWSEPASWETGLLNKSDWKAAWIESGQKNPDGKPSPNPFLRKEITIRGNVKEARIYVTCHGLYELHLNGRKVGDQEFTPGWTSYHHRLQYQVYDVTSQLVPGANVIGAMLGNGWYVGPFGFDGRKNVYGDNTALLLQLQVTYENGKEALFVTDQTWKSATGPVLKSEIYDGEIYDAGKELTGWDKTGYDDKEWKSCMVGDYGYDNLVASVGNEVRIIDTLHPVRKLVTPKGELVLDMGQNMVGRIQFRLKGIPGKTVIIHHAEVLDKAGNFYTANLRPAKQEIQYTFKGSGVETFEPHFTFMGFRYIRISGYSGDVNLSDVEGHVISSDMTPLGNFTCSDSLLNRLQKNIWWGLTGNFLDIPTDCPQRDERLGWTGDAQVFALTACFNKNTAPFFTKWLKDLAADQKINGSVPWVVPNIIINGGGTGWSDGYGSTGWADAAVVIPWTIYQYYGDTRILEQQYPSMKAWVDYMIRESGDDYLLNTGFHFGDWLSFAEYYSYYYNAPDYGYAGANTDKDLIATAYCYYSSGLLEKTALLLGKTADAQRMAEIRPKVKEAFLKEFMTPTGRLSSNTQTAYILALSFGLIPDNMKTVVSQRLADDVIRFGHLTTGFLGTPLILQALSDNGYPDIAYKLLFNKRYPSWLYPVTMGATTIWERWDGIKPDSTFQNEGMNSFNHYAYGAVGNWLYSRVAGLGTDPGKPGFKNTVISPEITGSLEFARAEFRSMYGKVVSGWKNNNGDIEMELVIPANTTAEVHFSAASPENISEADIPVSRMPGILQRENSKDRTVLKIGSGQYHFKISGK